MDKGMIKDPVLVWQTENSTGNCRIFSIPHPDAKNRGNPSPFT